MHQVRVDSCVAEINAELPGDGVSGALNTIRFTDELVGKATKSVRSCMRRSCHCGERGSHGGYGQCFHGVVLKFEIVLAAGHGRCPHDLTGVLKKLFEGMTLCFL